jgi:hypothetical protein
LSGAADCTMAIVVSAITMLPERVVPPLLRSIPTVIVPLPVPEDGLTAIHDAPLLASQLHSGCVSTPIS